MKRDLNTMRTMMQYIRDNGPKTYDRYPWKQHADLMLEVKWAIGFYETRFGETTIERLTDEGFRFLDIANDDRWAKVQPLLGHCSVDLIVEELERLAAKETTNMGET